MPSSTCLVESAERERKTGDGPRYESVPALAFCFPDDEALNRLDAAGLKALRKDAARALHPDLNGNGSTANLADLNARIDERLDVFR